MTQKVSCYDGCVSKDDSTTRLTNHHSTRGPSCHRCQSHTGGQHSHVVVVVGVVLKGCVVVVGSRMTMRSTIIIPRAIPSTSRRCGRGK